MFLELWCLLLFFLPQVYLFLRYTSLGRSGDFNYDSKYRGSTVKPADSVQQDRELSDSGFSVNHTRILVGSGCETFEKGKSALQNWRLCRIYCLFIHKYDKLHKYQNHDSQLMSGLIQHAGILDWTGHLLIQGLLFTLEWSSVSVLRNYSHGSWCLYKWCMLMKTEALKKLLPHSVLAVELFQGTYL